MVARSNFSDNQDHALVQLAVQHQSAAGPIDWERVTKQFPSRQGILRKTKLELRQRLKVLKRTYGNNFQAFPPRFFRRAQPSTTPRVPTPCTAPPTRRIASATRTHGHLVQRSSSSIATTQQSSLLHATRVEVIDQVHGQISLIAPSTSITSPTQPTVDAPSTVISPPVELMDIVPRLVRRTKQTRDSFEAAHGITVTDVDVTDVDVMSVHDVYSAIARMFATITQADVRQPSGRRGLNAGEILPVGVTKMIEVMSIKPTDVFGDIGSGTGSVLAQVALQTSALRCYGVEIQQGLAAQSKEYMQRFVQAFPRLSRVFIQSGDIKDMTNQMRQELRACTILFCSNKVFNPEDNLAVQEFVTASDARLVLLTDRFCGRCHGDRCPNTFCQMWESEPTIKVCASWAANPVDLFVYHRRLAPSTALMDLLASM